MEKKKEKKTKLNNKAKILIAIALFLFIALTYVPVTSKIKIRLKGYSRHSVTMIYNKNLTKTVTEKDYSEFIDKTVADDSFDVKNIDKYYELNYVDKDNLLIEVNNYISKDYKTSQINLLEEKATKELYEYLIENKVDDIDKYFEVEIFKQDRIDRYLKSNQGDYKDTVLFVNMDRDKPYYEDANIIKEYSVDMLVNKHNKLEEEYTPDLVKLDKCSEGEHYLTKEAKKAYDKLCDAITKDGLSLGVNSSYRSYQDQKETYDFYLKSYGQDYVNKYVATPGYSEHQTGLALDVMSLVSSPFKTTEEFKWMKDNAYKYGFILRYEEDKEDIVGYNYESWHYRYVGEKIAKEIFDSDLTFDEYYALYLDK